MRRLRSRILANFLVLAGIVRRQGQKSSDTRLPEDFRSQGLAIWQCRCPAYGCPCQKNGLPTQGMCHASDFAHIQKGHYGKVSLDRLNVVMLRNLVDCTPDHLIVIPAERF